MDHRAFETLFRFSKVNGKYWARGASLLSVGLTVLSGAELAKRDLQKCTKSAPVPIRPPHDVMGEKPAKELLHQVLGIVI